LQRASTKRATHFAAGAKSKAFGVRNSNEAAETNGGKPISRQSLSALSPVAKRNKAARVNSIVSPCLTQFAPGIFHSLFPQRRQITPKILSFSTFFVSNRAE
jgi:hypothetical protein